MSEVPLYHFTDVGGEGLHDEYPCRGNPLTRKRTSLGPYNRTTPGALWGSEGGGRFLMIEVPLHSYELHHKSRDSGTDCDNITPVILQGLIEFKDTHRP